MTDPGSWQTPPPGAPQQQPTYAQTPLSPAERGVAGGAVVPGRAAPLQYWHQPTTPGGPGRKPRRPGRVINIILIVAVALVTAITLAFFAASLGASVFLICGALALIPLTICLLTLYWVDRWEPEPKGALLFAFCWGAGMSIITSLVVGQWVQPLLLEGAAMTDPETVGAVLQAPLVEETSKGLGVLLLFFLRRRTFDGPIDGVVYAGTIAAGFAFTENILYFSSTLVAEEADAAVGLVLIFLVRGLMSPFAHVMFTATLGAVVGYAARYGGTPLVVGAWFVGLVPAMFLHGLWNASSLINENFFLVYGALQMPIFVIYVVGIIMLRRSEAKLTRNRLSDYVPSGWIHPQEVPMLGTGAGRRRALAWAGTFGAAKDMRRLIMLATRLAFNRQRILVGSRQRQSPAAAARTHEAISSELILLRRTTDARATVLARQQAAAQQAMMARYASQPPHPGG
ncbi:PrsW family intramembrane metalloprotease [Arthrobacter sp. 35W]|uniref:PrsW family intramembrane metalloprotease n=1 Tax=Arthrobacter sp. 35W TaxID=1132441 RepID=UPI0006884C00|nr:PrsW family intramembrane metalloprotease [Arthrobacter sp. 35W]